MSVLGRLASLCGAMVMDDWSAEVSGWSRFAVGSATGRSGSCDEEAVDRRGGSDEDLIFARLSTIGGEPMVKSCFLLAVVV